MKLQDHREPPPPRAPRDTPAVRTLKEVGAILGVSHERVRQIEARAFRKLAWELTKLEIMEARRRDAWEADHGR